MIKESQHDRFNMKNKKKWLTIAKEQGYHPFVPSRVQRLRRFAP
jgi:hypothetical protein